MTKELTHIVTYGWWERFKKRHPSLTVRVAVNPKCLKVVDQVGTENPSYITGGDKTQITILACTSAAGYAMPPFVIFDRLKLNPKHCEGEVPGTLYGLSYNGWMNQDLFHYWFLHHFLSMHLCVVLLFCF